MVTGVESAGLVLAAFALIIQGTQVYANCARTIKGMKRQQMILAQYSRALSVEQVKFENTCENLLADIVSLEHSTLRDLINNPGGPEWRKSDFETKLSSRLRPASANQFVQAAEELKQRLEDLGEYFEVG